MENISCENITLLPYDFIASNYKALYNDLSNMNEDELKNHYINNSFHENRIYKITLPEDFNCYNYKYLNYDLQHISDEDIKNHYIEFGYYEKRNYKINLPNDFIPFNYKFLNNDLFNMNEEELKNHYINDGFCENRFYKIYLPEDFNSEYYKELNNDLYSMNEEELKIHYINHGFYENRLYKINFENIQNIENNKNINFINTHKDIKYNNKSILNINKLFDNIILYVTDVYDKNILSEYININYFKNQYVIINPIDKINNNISIFKSFDLNDNKYELIINNKDISFNYLQYIKINIEDLFISNKYEIIELSLINNKKEFYDIINNNIEVCNLVESKYNFDCYIINKNGVNKILENLNNNNYILNNLSIGYYTRPLFGYNIENYNLNDNTLINYYLSKNLWDSYYRVTNYWNKIYCINLGFDIEKRHDMKKYCNLLNSSENNFFYDGILGLNLPNINTLINMGIYNSFIQNKFNVKIGTIGLNITQSNIINDAINNNYDYALILEDDISFRENYFETLDIIFNNYKDIDILYLGYSMFDHNKLDLFDKLDTINNYNIYKPKKNLCEKIRIGGFFSILLSKKALKIYIDRYTPIDNISDVLLCDLSFDIKNDFSNNTFLKTNYNLNTIFIDHLVIMDTSKPSLTEENNFDMLADFKKNISLNYLSKIKKFNFKISQNYLIKIYLSEFIKLYYKKIINIITNIIKNIKFIDFYDENTDIILFTPHDNLNLTNKSINICINGESKDCNLLTDIAIISKMKYDYPYNIYFPQIFTSLWERKSNYYNIKNNTREYFCAYMYSYNLEYRVEIYNFISKYKKVDALGKSCSNIEETDRFIYNDNVTYNDIAVEKYSKYKFVLALENGIFDGYVTEKLINPILANSIPIYAGPKDIFDIFNKKRVIYVYDFNNYDDLLEYIIKVDNDDNLYNSIILEEIFIGNINFNNIEEYLSLKLKKSLGFENKNILMSYNDNFFDYNKYDFLINDFYIPYRDLKLIKRYLSNYTNKNDNIIISYNNKIDFIDNIFWINLDRSLKRKSYMENIFNSINILNTRISAIDAKNSYFPDMIKNLDINESLTNYEIACTLSHLKAINYASNSNGEYFMICEDDIAFYNLKYFKKSLKNIILESPPFDILLIFKACLFELDNTYVKWKDYYDKGSNFYIYGTVCYIISRNGINKLKNYFNYEEKNIFTINRKINVADIYIYDNLDTYVYKYNFIATLDEESTIHSNHLDFQSKCSQNQNSFILKDIDYI